MTMFFNIYWVPTRCHAGDAILCLAELLFYWVGKRYWINNTFYVKWWWEPWRKVSRVRGWRCWEWRGVKSGLTANGTCEQEPGTSKERAMQLCGKSARQEGSKSKPLMLPCSWQVWGRRVSVSEEERGQEKAIKAFFTTLQTTLCFKVTLCCLDVIKGKIGIL